MYRIYNLDYVSTNIKPELIITEDSNSGYQFFNHLCEKNGLECISAEGKSNIFAIVKRLNGQNILIIADGAAFGPEMERVMKLMQIKNNVNLYLPESFEWIVLSSELLADQEMC